MTNAAGAGQFGDTTFTKVFVGGLAWETQKETMKKYFEQFGEILEAVVITDKTTGRSKGYGFVTFREADAAMRACADAAPVIDGRRANCNLASMGVQRSKPSTPKNNGLNGGGRNMRVAGGGGFHHQYYHHLQQQDHHQGAANRLIQAGLGTTAYAYPQYSIQQGIPYNLAYGYSPYSAEYAYPTSYYGVYGGGNAQYASYGSGGMLSSGGGVYYPYLNMSDQGGITSGAATGYTGSNAYGTHQYAAAVQHPHVFHYSPISSTAQLYPPHYATPAASLASPSALQSVCLAVPQA